MLPLRHSATSLDGTWGFVADPDRRLAPELLPEGVPITVPGAWEAQLPEPQGIVRGWYHRRFRLPADARPGLLSLRFAAALRSSRVWLDGRFVGEQEDGFVPFELEAGTSKPGAEHHLVVAVENPFNALTGFPAFDRSAWKAIDARLGGPPLAELAAGKQTWYTSTSGLLGSVTAALLPECHLAGLTLRPDADHGTVTVRWQLRGGRPGARSPMEVRVAGPALRSMATRTVDAAAGEAIVEVPEVERWDLGRPALYTLTLRLGRGGSVDEATTRFGFRTIAARDGRVILNGRPIQLRGALDQDLWPDGRSNPPSRAAREAQALAIAGMGINLLRCHGKVPDATYLDVTDEAGLLAWCELPSWSRFSNAAGARARDLLGRMVDGLGHHPSVIAWTIVNEDWGTDLTRSPRDRRWLRDAAGWLRERDPARLVVDNSACETPSGPNFHLETDIADFHAYRSVPDGGARWRTLVEELAGRPAWLWSPFGDAATTAQEPLVVSEFGPWGLPRPSAARNRDGSAPWWFETGDGPRRPAGIERRFAEQRLDRIWPDVDALAEATQWQQFEGLAAQVRELRRHDSIAGYVITELADAFWEANGLLDLERRPKAFGSRLGEVNAEDLLIVELPRTDLWSGESLGCEVLLACHPDRPRAALSAATRVEWRLRLADGHETSGSVPIHRWPDRGVHSLGVLAIAVSEVELPTEGELIARCRGPDGRAALHRERVVVLPAAARRTSGPRSVAVATGGRLEDRVRALGHRIVERAGADVVLSTTLDAGLARAVAAGRRAVVLAESPAAIEPAVGVANDPRVVARRPPDGDPAAVPWNGDWTSVFAWALPGMVPGLPSGGLLHRPHAEVFPEHVIVGGEGLGDGTEVAIGIVAGWLHDPAAILASVAHGAGRVTLTTLRLTGEGPMATALLETVIQLA